MKYLTIICILSLFCFQSVISCSSKKEEIFFFTNYECERCALYYQIDSINISVAHNLTLLKKHNFTKIFNRDIVKGDELKKSIVICSNRKIDSLLRNVLLTAKKLKSRLLIVAQPSFDKSKKNFSIHFSIIDLEKNCTIYNVRTTYKTTIETYKEDYEAIKEIANELSTIIKSII